ncbi:MAG: hypothetical protein WAQ52_05475 [Terriglobales bacterium]
MHQVTISAADASTASTAMMLAFLVSCSRSRNSLMMHGYDRVAIEAGEPELATDSDKLQKTVSELASKRAGYIMLAKSKMLDDFGEAEATDAILKTLHLRRFGRNLSWSYWVLPMDARHSGAIAFT